MSGLPLRKLYVDTRFKTKDSVSNSEFKFQLSRSAFMPVDSTFVIDEINIPYSWNTIEKDINDKLYVGWRQASNPLVFAVYTIPANRYGGTELATQLQTQMNAGAMTGTWTVVYNPTLNTITFSANLTVFKIFTDEDILASPDFQNKAVPQSINDIIQISGASSGYINSSSIPFTTGFLNLLNYQDLYLTSANLGSFDSQGPRGESTIIRKICVNAAWGYSIIDKIALSSDAMSCSKLSLSTIDFQLRDVKGRIVPLHGAHLSFVIKFNIE